jgi:aspartyl-tRNA(Asn)/glutamyl-tRNA(Gln) amidotransferase subunit C
VTVTFGCILQSKHRSNLSETETWINHRRAAGWQVAGQERHRRGKQDGDGRQRRHRSHGRIAVTEEEAEHLKGELNSILGWVEQLGEVPVADVEPMTSVVEVEMKKRLDAVTDGGISDDIVANAPETEDHYFVVPKVVE